MSIYEFNPGDAKRFADEFGNRLYHKSDGNLVFTYCPVCHGGAHKDKDTFAISLKTGQFECKRHKCRYRGNMITLAKDFNFEISKDVSSYYNINNCNGKFRKFHSDHIESKDNAIAYLKSRGISPAITKKYEITTKKDAENIIVFPFKNEAGELKFIKYRNSEFKKGETQGNKEWCEKNCMPILFGMNHCDPEAGPLIITEGQIDSLSVAEAGFDNAVSVPIGMNGFTWIPHCWDWLQSFKEIIIFGDHEKDRITLTEIADRFNGISRIVRAEDYKDCKDANDILRKYGKEAIAEAINNAEIVGDKHIGRLSNVKNVDFSKLEVMSTGIDSVDSKLSGGFHFGEIILLTGKRGDGKSTFMSQLIANARRGNIATFAYSGELMDWYFKNWIDRQIAGKEHLTSSEIYAINKYYDDWIYLYDNSIAEDGNETEIILESVEKAIKQYGCRFICIDNLMTAIYAGSNDSLYREQSNFVGKLAKIAKQFNVIVLLVAHPRKSNGYQFNNDDVSGSSDITNKVDIVLSYDRAFDDENHELDDSRELKVTKNRLTGHLTRKKNEILLDFDDASKRIVGSGQDKFYDTGWIGDGYTIYEDEENPF